MSTNTTNFNLVKPEAGDPVDIDNHWNNNLAELDTQLNNADHDTINRGYESWRLVSSKTIASGGAYNALTTAGSWAKNTSVGSPNLINQSTAVDGAFQFLVPGIYNIVFNIRTNTAGSVTEASVSAIFANGLTEIPGLNIYADKPGTSLGFYKYLYTASATFKIYDPTNDPGGTYDFTTSDVFNVQAAWVCNPSSTSLVVEATETWLQFHPAVI